MEDAKLPPTSRILAAKGLAPLDPYTAIALAEAKECKTRAEADAAEALRRKSETRRALDEQVRLKKEREQLEKMDGAWIEESQRQLKDWQEAEQKKKAAVVGRNQAVKEQLGLQLEEKKRAKDTELAQQREYEINLLKGVQREMEEERKKEAARKAEEKRNMEAVISQNVKNKALAEDKIQREKDYLRKKEQEAKESEERMVLQRARAEEERLAKVGSGRGSEGGETMQQRQERIAREDEARADARIAKDAADAIAKEAAKKAIHEKMKKECLDTLGMQLRDKEMRKQEDEKLHESLSVHARQEERLYHESEQQRKEQIKAKNLAYAAELKEQIKMERERKLLEPFEISKAEREINRGLLEKLSTQMTTSAKR